MPGKEKIVGLDRARAAGPGQLLRCRIAAKGGRQRRRMVWPDHISRLEAVRNHHCAQRGHETAHVSSPGSGRVNQLHAKVRLSYEVVARLEHAFRSLSEREVGGDDRVRVAVDEGELEIGDAVAVRVALNEPG
jgi:hypothetical protein